MYKGAPPIIASMLALLLPVQTVLLGTVILVLADLATGIWASRRQGVPITSDRLGRSIRKLFVYLTAVVTAQVAEVWMLDGGVPLVKVVAGLICSTELLSNYENLTRISGVDFKSLLIQRMMPAQPDKSERDRTGSVKPPPP